MGILREKPPRSKTEEVSGHYRPGVVKKGKRYIWAKDIGKKNPVSVPKTILKQIRIKGYFRRDQNKGGAEHQDHKYFPRRKTGFRKYRKL